MAILGTLTASRPLDATDTIDLVEPEYAVVPRNPAELAATLREAHSEGLHAVVATNHTKISWGQTPTSYRLAIDCREMEPVLEHTPSDLVVRVSASTAFASLQEVLAQHGQRLAVDEMVAGSSVGGVIATGICGPLRYGFGAVRDLLIGITVARADGVVAKSGGRVVKNVAGYDLGKLYTGSYGTLGVIIEAFFRLHPLPTARRFVTAELAPRDEARSLAALRASQVAPSAIEVYRNARGAPLSCSVLIEGRPGSSSACAATVADLFGTDARTAAEPPDWWGLLPGTLTVKLTSNLASLPSLVDAVDEIAQRHHLAIELTGSAGVGVVFVGWSPADEPGRAEEMTEVIEAFRAVALGCGGSATLLRAPLAYRHHVDPWGPVSGLELMRRIKDQFDPTHLLSPGRFVGGI